VACNFNPDLIGLDRLALDCPFFIRPSSRDMFNHILSVGWDIPVN